MALSVRPVADQADHQVADRHGLGGRTVALLVAAVLVVGVIVACIAVVFADDSGSTAGYSWYHKMMGSYGSGMMGRDAPSWMMGQSGYGWMVGGVSAPGWMRGGSLPSPMMGGSTDPGKVMGRLFANAPGPRVSSMTSSVLGSRVPTGATVNRAANTVTFSTLTVKLPVLASPTGSPDETFRMAGLVNPTIVVSKGSRVTMQLVNADMDTAHGLVVAAGPGNSLWMPMMSARLAFPHSGIWFLGDGTSAGFHTASATFVASISGSYRYICPVPGHAQKGMWGEFVVSR